MSGTSSADLADAIAARDGWTVNGRTARYGPAGNGWSGRVSEVPTATSSAERYHAAWIIPSGIARCTSRFPGAAHGRPVGAADGRVAQLRAGPGPLLFCCERTPGEMVDPGPASSTVPAATVHRRPPVSVVVRRDRHPVSPPHPPWNGMMARLRVRSCSSVSRNRDRSPTICSVSAELPQHSAGVCGRPT
jgi:hypothetical protein